jgi:hypothetical protein
VPSNLGVTGGDRARHWRTTAIFALWPTIMAAIAAIVHSRDRAGDLVLAAYFGTVSALLFIQAARARREGRDRRRSAAPRWRPDRSSSSAPYW